MGVITMPCSNFSISVETADYSVASGKNAQGVAEPTQPKGRVASKLSSRHSRRKQKRIEREHKEQCAIKSRTGKRSRDTIPIPSFTPITGEYYDESAAKINAEPETSKASLACPTADSTTKLIANTAGAQTDTITNDHRHSTSSQGASISCMYAPEPSDSEQKYAKKQKAVHSKDGGERAEAQQMISKTVVSTGSAIQESLNCISKENKSSGRDPTELSSATSSKEVAPHAGDKPSLQKSSSDQCSPQVQVGNGTMGKPQEDDFVEENHSSRDPTDNIDGAATAPKSLQIPNQCLPAVGDSLFGNQQSEAKGEQNPVKRNVKGVDTRLIEETGCDGNDTTEGCSGNQNPHGKVDTLSGKQNNETNLETVILSNKLSSKKTKRVPLKESAVKDRNDCNNNNIKCQDKANKLPKHCNVDEPRTPEVIEIVDDDCNDESTRISMKERPDKSDASRKKGDNLGKNRKVSKQTKKKHKLPVSISRSSSDSPSEDDVYERSKMAYDQKGPRRQDQTTSKENPGRGVARGIQKKGRLAEKKQSKKSAGKKLCSACSSCKCHSRAGTAATPEKFSSLSGSDARQEQTLVNRLQRTEREIAWKEGQRNDFARALKRHQNQMLKKWEARSSNSQTQRPRFLADTEFSETFDGTGSKVGSKEMNRAQKRIFSREKVHQPTLTQIIRGPKDDDADQKLPSSENNNNNLIIDCSGNNNFGDRASENTPKIAQHESSSPDSHDNFLSFWADTAPIEDTVHSLGAMNDFNHALASFQGSKSTGKWAKATANTLQLEEDEGLDALVELFDASLENHDSNECIDCSQNSIDNDDGDGCSPMAQHLSPRGKQAADQIEQSVKDDPQKKAAVERMCPNWAENIRFAHAQTDPKDLQNALQSIRQAKMDLESMKDRIMQAFLDRQQTLDLYELSIQGSVARLLEIRGGDACMESELLSQHS